MNSALAIFGSFALSFASAATAQPATAPVATPSAPYTAPEAVAAERSPVERASDDAVARLYAQMAGERVDGLPVSQIIDRVGGKAAMIEGLARAEQIGGPRAVADGVVQVSLEISGERAAELVTQIVAAAPEKSPITPERLSRSLASWQGRSFFGTGSNIDRSQSPGVAARDAASTAQTQAVRLTLPEVPPAWMRDAQTAKGVSEKTSGDAASSPLRTARAAEKSARANLRQQLFELKLDEQTNLSAAGRDATDAIDAAVAAARIAGVDYRADGSVEVSVSVDGQQLWRRLQLAAQPQ